MIAKNTQQGITTFKTAIDVSGTSAKLLRKAFEKGYYSPDLLYVVGASDETDINQFTSLAQEYPNLEVIDIRVTDQVIQKAGYVNSGEFQGYGGINFNERGEIDNSIPESAFTIVILPAYTTLFINKYGDGNKTYITKVIMIGNLEGQTFGGTAKLKINMYKETFAVPYTNLISIHNSRTKGNDNNYRDNPNYKVIIAREDQISRTCTVTPFTSERYKEFIPNCTDKEAMDFLDIEAVRLVEDIDKYSDVNYEEYEAHNYSVDGIINNFDVIRSNEEPGLSGLISLNGENWRDIISQITYKNFIHTRVSDGSRIASKVFIQAVGGIIDSRMKDEFFKTLETTGLYFTDSVITKQSYITKEGEPFRILIQFYGIKEKAVTTSQLVQTNNNLTHRDLTVESAMTMDMSDIDSLLATNVKPKVVYQHIGPAGQNQAKYNNWVTPTITTAEVMEMDGYLNLPQDEKRGVLINRKQRNCL
jgi:hypothetical protein